MQLWAMATPLSTTAKSLLGFGLPINVREGLIRETRNGQKESFPDAIISAVFRRYEAPLLTCREYTMMELMNRITDKPGWDRKIFAGDVQSKWKAEALNLALISQEIW